MPASSVGGSSFLSGPPKEKKVTTTGGTKVTTISDTSRSGLRKVSDSPKSVGSTTTTTTTTRVFSEPPKPTIDRSQSVSVSGSVSGSVQRKKKDGDAPTIPGQRRSVNSKGVYIEGDEVAVGSEYAAIHRQIFAVQSMLKTREDMLDIQECRIRNDEPDVMLSRDTEAWVNRPSLSPTRIREGCDFASSEKNSFRSTSTMEDIELSPRRTTSVRHIREPIVHTKDVSNLNSLPSVIPAEREIRPGPHPCLPDGPTRHDLRDVSHPHLQARVESLENEVARLRDENTRLLNASLLPASDNQHSEVQNASFSVPFHRLVDRAVSASEAISHLSARRSELQGVSPAHSNRRTESFAPPVNAPNYDLGRNMHHSMTLYSQETMSLGREFPTPDHVTAMVPAPYHQAPSLPAPLCSNDTVGTFRPFTRPPGDPGRRSPPPPSTAQPPSMSYVEDVIAKHDATRTGRVSPLPFTSGTVPPPLPSNGQYKIPSATLNNFPPPVRNSPIPRSESFQSHATQIPESRGPIISPPRNRSFTPPTARGSGSQGYRRLSMNQLPAGSVSRSSVRSASSRAASRSIDDFRSEFTRITGKMVCLI